MRKADLYGQQPKSVSVSLQLAYEICGIPYQIALSWKLPGSNSVQDRVNLALVFSL